MEAKIAKKRELQKKAGSPRNFAESVKQERERQSDLKKLTKEERRDAMCEELGRGC